MARIPPSNPRYRTKSEICHDVAKVLNSDLTYGTKFPVVNQVNWVWTESFGKYRGCPYWSVNAIEQYAGTGLLKGLKHEHVVPKKIINQMIFELDGHATPDAVRAIYDKYLIGVVVTNEEDQRLNKLHNKSMPREFVIQDSPDYQNPWLRYKLCNIPVTFMRHAIEKILPKKSLMKQRVRNRLLKKLNRHHWIDKEFDWSNWNQAEELSINPVHWTTFDCDTIRKLFTLHVRKERLCEGHLNSMFANGHIAALLERLKVIISHNEDRIRFD